MTVFFDTSAAMALHIESPLRKVAFDALGSPTCISAHIATMIAPPSGMMISARVSPISPRITRTVVS